MGILRINRSKSQSDLPEDGHRQDFKDTSSNDDEIYPSIKASYSYFWGGVLFIALIMCVIGAVGYWLSVSTSGRTLDNKYVYFELKTLGIAGEPTPGARVYYNKKQVGVTDSYGEWRRFMKVKIGSQVTFRVRKHQHNKRLFGKIVLPVPESIGKGKEPELSGTVKLKLVKKTSKSLTKTTNKIPATLSAKPKLAPHKRTTTVTTTIAPSMSQVSQKDNKARYQGATRFYRSVWFSVVDNGLKQPLARKKTSQLKTYVIPRLKSFARSYGLEVMPQAQWQVTIRHLSANSQDIPGLIRVGSNQYLDTEKIDFLRNYTGSAEKTSQVILRGLKSHIAYPYWVNKSKGQKTYLKPQQTQQFWTLNAENRISNGTTLLEPLTKDGGQLFTTGACKQPRCLFSSAYTPLHPPRSTWQRFNLKIFGLPETSLSVYVSGIKAVHKGDKSWEYWGTSRANMYLAVVIGQQVIARKLIRPKPNGLVISLPALDLVRKN